MKVEIYRENGYSWIYILDAVAVEIVKMMQGKGAQQSGRSSVHLWGEFDMIYSRNFSILRGEFGFFRRELV